ncbi:MAG: sensor histidine kinase [Crocinitomicaceae bacterium]
MLKATIYPFHTWWAFLLANLALGMLITVLFSNMNLEAYQLLISIGWSFANSFTLWTGNAFIQTFISKKYNWLDFPVQRFIWTVISVVVYSGIAFIAVQCIMYWLVYGRSPIDTIVNNNSSWSFPIFISFFVSVVIGAIGFFTNWRKSELMQEQLKSEMLNYKYEALKNQINPHFMFNSLNVLSELVHEDQDLAVKYIHKFSDMYRYVLESKDHELRALKEELDFLDKYIFLLKIRFEDKLIVEIDAKDEGDLIVPVALQLLVENAVKHNEVSKSNPLAITIRKENNWIIVQNKLQPKTSKEHSSKIGLKNLEQQYGFFKREIVVEESESIFTVKVPILKAEK